MLSTGRETPLAFFLAILETMNDSIEDGVHHAMIAHRVVALGAIPDVGEGGYIGGREDCPFEQAVL